MSLPFKSDRGFTLLEFLLFISILTVIFVILIVALNPQNKVAQINNDQRIDDIQEISRAISKFMAIEGYVIQLPQELTNIGSAVDRGDVDICTLLVPEYLDRMPYDPSAEGAGYLDCNAYNTQYQILQSSDGSVTIVAPHAELSEEISIGR
jgi:type II secretory pathway pseudopilin PulG